MNELEAARARQKMAEISADYGGESVEVAREQLDNATSLFSLAERAEAELEDNLRTAQQATRRRAESRAINLKKLQTAQQHEQAVAALQATIDAADGGPTTDAAVCDFDSGAESRDGNIPG